MADLNEIAAVLRRKRTFTDPIRFPCPVKGCDNEMDYRDRACEACLLAAADACDAVGRLPRTADGVPLVPGMELWYTPFEEIQDADGEGTGKYNQLPPEKWHGIPSDRMFWSGASGSAHGSGPHDSRDFYSSRQAAEAAAKETRK